MVLDGISMKMKTIERDFSETINLLFKKINFRQNLNIILNKGENVEGIPTF